MIEVSNQIIRLLSKHIIRAEKPNMRMSMVSLSETKNDDFKDILHGKILLR